MRHSSFLKAGHTPTLFAAFFYFDISFMVWVLLGPLGVAIAKSLHLDAGIFHDCRADHRQRRFCAVSGEESGAEPSGVSQQPGGPKRWRALSVARNKNRLSCWTGRLF